MSGRGSRTVVGVMTGTSLDGLDAVVVHIDGHGLTMRAEPGEHVHRVFGDLGERLRAAAEQTPMSAGDFAALGRALGEVHADAIVALLPSGARPDLIAVHGQTIFHAPPDSWQLLDPWPIAHRFDVPVVHDLRGADLASGGEGAPITPLADWILFRDTERRRVIVNLGGFVNVTTLPRDADTDTDSRPIDRIGGGDVCACNHVLDAVARRVLDAEYDENGRLAASGVADPSAAATLRTRLTAAESRSLGTGDESLGWIDEHLDTLAPADLAATAVQAIAGVVAGHVSTAAPDEVVLAGGGARNATLVARLRDACDAPVVTSDALGVGVDVREAAAIAILGALCADGVPITLPHVTGCAAPAPLAGRWCRPP